jgi:type I restriction enzyme, S subunit
METVKGIWKPRRISELLTGVIDYRGKTPPKSSSGIPCISAANVKNGVVTIKDKYISEEPYTKWTTRGFIKPGDVLITTEAPVAEVAQVPGDQTYLITRRVMALQVDPDIADERFLKYILLDGDNKQKLANLAHGATVPRVYKEDILDCELLMPPLPSQHKIAAILSAYDDLIENNTRRIRILEEMAQTIYREWFVHFRFPGHEGVRMVDSGTELGIIPEGWEVNHLVEVCHLLMGQSPKSEFYNSDGEGLPFHQGVTDFGNRFPTHTKYCTVENRVAEQSDILFSVRAPVGRINLADRKLIIGRGICAIRSKSGNQVFLFHQLTDKFQEEDTMGSGAIFNAVTKKDMQDIKLLTPQVSIVAQFEEIVTPLFAEIKNLTIKNINLRTTRDLLLPKLVSGEVDVSGLVVERAFDV